MSLDLQRVSTVGMLCLLVSVEETVCIRGHGGEEV